MELCKAERADLEEILQLQKVSYLQEAEIYNDFTIQPLMQTIDSVIEEWEQGIILKVEENGEIIGSVRGVLVDNVCLIGKLIVNPDAQNKGIGKMLMNGIEQEFISCSHYELFTGFKSNKNLYLYNKLGYSIFAEEKISDNLTLVRMKKINNMI